jgi:predicted MFS family arabinose efflux permease
MLGTPLLVFIPVVVRDVYHLGPEVFTTLLVVSGTGAVVGALMVAAYGHAHNKGRVALLSMFALGILTIGFGLSRSLLLSGVLLFFAAAVLVALYAMVSSLVQLIAPDEMRGRVMSVYNVAFRGGMPIGSLLSGDLITKSSVGTVLTANGIALAILAAWFLLVQRRVARL